ncbi:unnamed protein product [Miscanthus lutarioriparius]|uniref:Uncharacterized protein n=1 Tax=Miscanthus lutarioriparius TaxID=422564 RepID=A0A811SLR6_9POAL|nr:unnamed protein product [Miscanthus lutarioriparius]
MAVGKLGQLMTRLHLARSRPPSTAVAIGGGRAAGPPGGVRGRGAEAAGDPNGVPEPPGVRDAAEAGGGRVRLRPPLRRPHHPLRVGRRLGRHRQRRRGRPPPPSPMSDDRARADRVGRSSSDR